jgi:hypothetical protein
VRSGAVEPDATIVPRTARKRLWVIDSDRLRQVAGCSVGIAGGKIASDRKNQQLDAADWSTVIFQPSDILQQPRQAHLVFAAVQ